MAPEQGTQAAAGRGVLGIGVNRVDDLKNGRVDVALIVDALVVINTRQAAAVCGRPQGDADAVGMLLGQPRASSNVIQARGRSRWWACRNVDRWAAWSICHRAIPTAMQPIAQARATRAGCSRPGRQ